ncbi:MAG TPA: ChbG/HpnK family deacetylase, partial [Verrucomicrobiota bacterium]|nr:ChbG/HpnK family deacetylase [Verrucomicrobiota bacterium]
GDRHSVRQIAYIADDFGRSPAINAAIIRAHCEGALTGASLMVGQPASDEAVALARTNPQLEVGWHLHLCDSQPTTVPTWPWGESPFRAGVKLGASTAARDLTQSEIQNQWRLFEATGLPCRFVNSHHHLHLHPLVLGEIRRTIGDDFAGWLRGFDFRLWDRWHAGGRIIRLAGQLLARTLSRRWPGECSRTVWGLDRLYRMNASEILSVIPRLPDGRHEFVFHPGAATPDSDLRTLLELGKPSRSRA